MGGRTDRIIGTLLGMACGDALGAGYEFTTPTPGTPIIMKGGGGFGWDPGEWTDDTQMALCIAEETKTGHLDSAAIGGRFLRWLRSGPKDVGVMTRAVLSAAASGGDLPEAARAYCRSHPRSAGNGSLMRTAPVALAHLGDQGAIDAAAREVSDLTHADPLCGDACVLWCLAIDHAVSHAEFDLRPGLRFVPEDRRPGWAQWIDEAETRDPSTFTPNGFVVTALQAAWASITQTPISTERPARHLTDTLISAVRIGYDTDTVAAIAGALLGARWGASAVPLRWKAMLHGSPGYDARDLARLAVLTSRKGEPDKTGWPSADDLLPWYRKNEPHVAKEVALVSDPGVTIGNAEAAAITDADVVLSLCRMGSQALRPDGRHVDVVLMDDTNPAANPNLAWILEDTADAIADWRSQGKTVFLHCVQAHNRTPAMAAAYLMRTLGKPHEEALDEVVSVLGNGPSNSAFRAALPGVEPRPIP